MATDILLLEKDVFYLCLRCLNLSIIKCVDVFGTFGEMIKLSLWFPLYMASDEDSPNSNYES